METRKLKLSKYTNIIKAALDLNCVNINVKDIEDSIIPCGDQGAIALAKIKA